MRRKNLFKFHWVTTGSLIFGILTLILLDFSAAFGQQTLDMAAEGIKINYPDGWYPAPSRYTNAYELVNASSEELKATVPAKLSWIFVTTEKRKNHKEALRRLKEIAAEVSSPSTFLTIGRWPALQRRYLAPLARPGGSGAEAEVAMRITTAIAAGRLLLRIEGNLAPGAAEDTALEVEEIGKKVLFERKGNLNQSQREIEELKKEAPPAQPKKQFSQMKLGAASVEVSPGANMRIDFNPGVQSEVEIAVSPDGQNVVVGSNIRDYMFSTDGGLTFTQRAINPGFPANGDPSLAYGASGDFYFAFIAYPDGSAAANNVTGCSTGIAVSTDNGQTFTFRNHAALCPFSGAGICFTDQEHIAADRWNSASGGGDQVYSVWRNFVPSGPAANCGQIGSGFVTPSIVCSTDGGANWSAPAAVGTGDVPRVGVGPDGFVYVIYRNGNSIVLNKFSSCANGLAQQSGFPVTVASVTDVACPLPGIDRCNDGNLLSSHMVAVDDLDANHVYVTYATNTAAGNENVMIQDSTDGGATWPGGRVIQANASVTARRYMPWICTTGGNAFVTWYDRRASTSVDNSLTDFYGGRAFRDGSGNLVAGTEFLISDIADSNCGSGWPCAPRSSNDSESCTVQPQLAGFCAVCTSSGCTGSFIRCDFSSTACPSGETCNTGGGCPKYGDYNGNGCAAGRFFTAWASATSPPSITPPSTDIDVFFSAVNVLAPTANAGGPYTTNEGTNVTLNGTGSTDPTGQPFTYAWDLNNDGVFGDAVGPTPIFDNVGEEGVFDIALRVTNTSGFSSIDETTVTVLNVPPTVTLSSNAPQDEGSPVTVNGLVSDPGWLDPLTATVNWGDGSPTAPVSGTLENVRPDATLTFTVSHTYGDNGTYNVEVCANDGDATTCQTIPLQINNVPPIVSIDSLTPAQPAPGQPVELQGSFTDPGWLDTHTAHINWGDGKSDDPPLFDLTNSPPASTGKVKVAHSFCAPGIFPVELSVTDDDGGVGIATENVTIDLSPDMPGMIKTDDMVRFLTVTGTLPGTLGSATWQWRNGYGTASLYWIYQNLTKDYLFFFIKGRVPKYDSSRPISTWYGNFFAITVKRSDFETWFWCGIPLYDKYGRFTGYGCHPEYGPGPPDIYAPWVQLRIDQGLPYIIDLLSKAFGGSCP